DYLNILRFAPSACNLQPWFIAKKDDVLNVYRYFDSSRRGIMPKDKVVYYNRIDMGIFLLVLELVLEHNNFDYRRTLFDDNDDLSEYVLCAKYEFLL
ncbi:MAG: nitroreductase, partial [Erysipelotrichaceae bacterium]